LGKGIRATDIESGLDTRIYKKILDNLHDGVCFLDREGKITYWNRGAESITGYKSRDVTGSAGCESILKHVSAHGISLCNGKCPIVEVIEKGKYFEDSLFIHHRDGYRVPALVCMAPIRDTSGKIIGAVEIFTDNSWKVAAVNKIEELKKLALLDPLTETGNRRHAEMTLNGRLDEMRRYGSTFGVLMLDIDNFKLVNDTFGHDIGDKTLRMVSRTLVNTLRPFDVLCRYGGDEFLLVALYVNSENIGLIAERLRMLVKQSSFKVGPSTVSVTVSIGATLAREDDSFDSVLKRADSSMYESKQAGRNCVYIN
jgi:diguanylate cyclase (GGDEF)-like protein/PAS domain S-box-containing protein